MDPSPNVQAHAGHSHLYLSVWKAHTQWLPSSFAQHYHTNSSLIQQQKDKQGEATAVSAKGAENKTEEIRGNAGSTTRPTGRQAALPLDQGPADQPANHTAS